MKFPLSLTGLERALASLEGKKKYGSEFDFYFFPVHVEKHLHFLIVSQSFVSMIKLLQVRR